MKRLVVVTGLVMAALSWTPLSFAFEKPCKDDIAKFCSDIEKGEGRIGKCLRENESKLSSDCKSKMAEFESKHGERRAKIREFGEACREDKQKYCSDVKPGEGRIIDCLNSHEKELSSSCKDKIPSRGGSK